jgi:hypothetical protein
LADDGYLEVLDCSEAINNIGDHSVEIDADANFDTIIENFSLTTSPNPFNVTTTITFDLPQAGMTSLKIFDIQGRETAVLAEGYLNAGRYNWQFEGAELSSGIYFIVLKSDNIEKIQKLILMK